MLSLILQPYLLTLNVQEPEEYGAINLVAEKPLKRGINFF